jgi:hypothetical protein
VFVATLIVGIAAVAAISAAPLFAGRLPFRPSPLVGASLVLAAIGLGCCAAGGGGAVVPLRQELFLCAFAALVAGALFLLAGGGGDDRGGGAREDDGDPPWWPEFEEGFRSYSRHPRVPVAGR